MASSAGVAPSPAQGPLSGVVVVDFSRVLAGPYATALLADLGARVIKVEPRDGDDYRHVGPWLGSESALFATVNRGQTNGVGPHPYRHSHGAGFRAVYDLADLARSRFIIATGQSGIPLSPHYRNMLDRWRNGGHVAVAMNRDAARRRAVDTLLLVPGTGR